MSKKILEKVIEKSKILKDKSYSNKEYSVFVEQFLEKPIMEERYSPIRAMGSWLIPTWCTWKGIPTIDDLDDI